MIMFWSKLCKSNRNCSWNLAFISCIYLTYYMEYVWTSSLWIGIFQRVTQGARILLACVASVSNRVIARKLEREQKKKKMEEGGGGEKSKRLLANPMILENAPWYFTIRFIWNLTARQNRSFTNRLPLDYQICKITLFLNRTCSRLLQKL